MAKPEYIVFHDRDFIRATIDAIDELVLKAINYRNNAEVCEDKADELRKVLRDRFGIDINNPPKWVEEEY